MRPRAIVLLTLIVLAAALPAAPALGQQIRGSAANVSEVDGAALGPVRFRIYSAAPGGETNTSASIQPYMLHPSLVPGGYVSQIASLPVAAAYELADVSMNDATGDHIGFFGVAGVTLPSLGNPLLRTCSTPASVHCLGRIDADDAGPILMDTRAGYGGPPHTIRPIGGLNPIPVVRVSNSCPAVQICLSWLDPPTYAGNMRPGSDGSPAPPSPVKGVRLYKNFTTDCTDPAGNDPGWTPIGSFNLGNTETTDVLPPPGTGCNYYALTVRLVGPLGDPSEIETFRVGAHSQGVGGSQTGARIVRFGATYIGHQIVNVTWESGVEGGVQGYYVTRSLSVSGPYERIAGFTRAAGDQHAYAASDRVPVTGRMYYYRLEILGRDGAVTTSSSATAVVPVRGGRPRPSVR